MSKEDVIEMESRMTGADVGFDLPTDDDGEAYVPSLYLEDKSSNFAAELESENFEEQATEKLGTALANLDERSQEIIKARWLDDEKATLHDLAAKYNVSAERIRQLEANALKNLKVRLILSRFDKKKTCRLSTGFFIYFFLDFPHILSSWPRHKR